MSECISGGAKQIIGDLLKHIKTEEGPDYVKKMLANLNAMPVCEVKTKKPRKVSLWQLCIREMRKGKKWDPTALKKLSKEYKAGTCPSPEFLKELKLSKEKK